MGAISNAAVGETNRMQTSCGSRGARRLALGEARRWPMGIY